MEEVAQSKEKEYSPVTSYCHPVAGATDRQMLALAFVGCVLPDCAEMRTPAFSPAGQMCQEEMIEAMGRAGLRPSLVVSVRPVSSFPNSRKIWIPRTCGFLKDGTKVSLISFLNITPVKQLWIGMKTVWEIVKWAWANRSAEHRVIYSYNLTVPPGLFTLLAARISRSRAMVSLCDINIPGQTVPDTYANRIDFWLHHKLIPKFDGHVAVADAIMEDFAPDKPYVRIDGGIPEALLSERFLTPQSPRDESHFTVAFAGTLHPVNGLDVLLSAFERIQGSRYRLLVAGGGMLADSVRSAAQADPRIRYLGFLSFPDVLDLYKSADLLVCMRPTKSVSTRYFFPSKLMEYLASGTPVLATCTGHVEHEYGRFCFLLREETPDALAAFIQKVANLPRHDRMAMGAAAREYMRQNKSWDGQGARIVEFIRETAAKR
ncbi:MAG: glycosyltransferase family 4 protein [Acidobacteriia bacterium]|nr:glycosyltransferase family 4 protein [Terriglobia bacterium]